MLSELPETWVSTTLGSVCGSGQYGWTTSATTHGEVLFLRTTDITKPTIDWASVPCCVDVPSDLSKYLLEANDIVVSRAGSVGFSKLLSKVPLPTVFASYLIRFKPNSAVEPRYVAAYMKSSAYWRDIGIASAGIALANVNATKLSALPLPLPPLSEQQRISDKLDTLLARVDACRDRLARVAPLLKRFRKSVLAVATSGRLTEDWRRAEASATWADCAVGDVTRSSFYGPRFGANDYTKATAGTPTIRTTDMTSNGVIEVTSATPRVIVPADKFEQYRVVRGDLLVTRTGSIGVMAVFEADYAAIPSAYLIRFRFNERVLPRYVFLALTAPAGQSALGLSSTALTQPNVNAEAIKRIPLRLPPLAEQTEIVRRVETLFAFSDRLEARLTQAQSAVDRLTPSLLAKAFRGELVPQDPADEPAAELLKRLAQSRPTTAPKTHRPRRGPPA